MLRRQNSPQHRNRNLLCGNLGMRAESVNCYSLGHSSSSQHHKLSSVGERTPSPTSPTSMASMRVREGDFCMNHPMDSMGCEFYFPPPPPMYMNLPGFSDYYPPLGGGFFGDPYEVPAPTLPHFGDPTNFGVMFPEPLAAQQQQPPIPPAPEAPIPSNSVFQHYPCRWLGGPRCDGFAPGRNREMGEHLRAFHRFVGHERDTVQCEWENCGQIMQRMNVPRHIVSRHLLAAANCRFCGRRFSRPDVVARHERTCSGAHPVLGGSTVSN